MYSIEFNVIRQKTTNKQHIGHKVGFFSDLVLLKMVRYITVFSLLYLMFFFTKKTSTIDGCQFEPYWKCGKACM